MNSKTPTAYYVTAYDPENPTRGVVPIAGPYDQHAEAVAVQPIATRAAGHHDPRACWYAFGTSKIRGGVAPVLGKVEPETVDEQHRAEAERRERAFGARSS